MQNDISSLYIDLSQTKKKTSKIVGARHASPYLDLRRCGRRATHASPLRSRFAVRLRGKKKTSKIVGARHAGHPKKRCPFFGDPDSPLSRLTPLRPEGYACVAPTFPLCRAVARQLTREIG